MSNRLLLDSCTILFIASQALRNEKAIAQIDLAAERGDLFASATSAWEIGMLAARGKFAIRSEPLFFFNAFLKESNAKLCTLEPEILIASSFLPHWRHKDPMDRLLVATARHLDLTLVTRDHIILEYGAKGHVKTLAC